MMRGLQGGKGGRVAKWQSGKVALWQGRKGVE